jgi:hypothetical protein
MAVSRATGRAFFLLIVVASGSSSRAELVTPAQKDLVKAERNLEAARERVAATAENASATGSLRTAREWVVRACQASLRAVERVRKDAEHAQNFARIEASEAEQLARAAGHVLEKSGSELERARDCFLNQPLVAYDISQRGRLTFNALTRAFDLRLCEGPGITLGTRDVETLLAGKFTLPDIDPLVLADAATRLRGRLTSNYDEVRASLAAEYGPANVYMLSRRFLEWASAARLSGDFATAILETGGTLEAEIAEAQRQVQLEYEDFAAWLRLKGVNDLGPEPCAALVDLIRTRSNGQLGLSVKTRPVDFVHRSEPAGSTEVPADLIKRLRPHQRPGVPTECDATERRTAIVFIWKGATSSHESLASELDSEFQWASPSIKNLPKLMPPQTDPRIRFLAGCTATQGLPTIDASAAPRRLARAALGLRRDDITSCAVPGRLTVDLRRSDFGEIVSLFLSQLALGNNKSCDVSVLELDQSSGRLEVEFTLRHRHVWPRIREAQTRLNAALGSVGTDIDDLADRLPNAAFDSMRKLYRDALSRSRDANARANEASKTAREATDRVSAKANELATRAGDLARAQNELNAVSELEARARRDAQAACVELLELNAKVQLARNQARGREPALPANPLIYGSHSTRKTW